MGIKRYAILNDIHFPFECRTRYKIALKIMREFKPDHIYLNGDLGEFMAVSTHPKHPSDGRPFSEEVDYINKKFDELNDIFQGVPATLICGNHSYRFFRYIRDVAPAMWGLIDCPSLLKFPERPGWKFVDYGPEQLVKCGVSNLYLRHEPLGMGANPAKTTAEASYIDIATGHCHKFQTYSHKKFGPKPITNTCYILGWLGDKSRHVFDYRGSKDTWVTGITVVEADEKTGDYSLEFISMQKLPVYFRGRHYDAK